MTEASQNRKSFLSPLQCEKCGSNELLRTDECFVCSYCGTHYYYDIKTLDIQSHASFNETGKNTDAREKSASHKSNLTSHHKAPTEARGRQRSSIEIRQQDNTSNALNKNHNNDALKRLNDRDRQQREKILQIAKENDETGLADIVAMLHATRPDKKAPAIGNRSFQSRIAKANLEDYSSYTQFLYAIYDYAKRTCKRLRHAIIAESKQGRFTASITLPEFTKETRRVQDLLTFVGIKDNINTRATPIGFGTVVSFRREKTLQVFIDKVKEICASDHISVDFHIEIKEPNIQQFFRCELPFHFKNSVLYPDEVSTRAIITGTVSNIEKDEASLNYIDISKVDSMSGTEFEIFCAELLAREGFSDIVTTKGSHDQGIDIIATNGMVKYGFQCKCYASDIGNSAIQEANAGKAFYECHIGVVITNRNFTSSAKSLAKKLGIILWDRDYLNQKLAFFMQNKS